MRRLQRPLLFWGTGLLTLAALLLPIRHRTRREREGRRNIEVPAALARSSCISAHRCYAFVNVKVAFASTWKIVAGSPGAGVTARKSS